MHFLLALIAGLFLILLAVLFPVAMGSLFGFVGALLLGVIAWSVGGAVGLALLAVVVLWVAGRRRSRPLSKPDKVIRVIKDRRVAAAPEPPGPPEIVLRWDRRRGVWRAN
jgi:membrane protein implicated in regulation of membrane protease activity